MKSREEKTTSGAARNNDEPKRDDKSRASRGKRRSGFAVSRDGAAIFFEVLGQPHPAPTLILCDGLGCDGYVWKYLQWALADTYRIVHMNYRGHGQTPLPADFGQVHIADFAADVLSVMDASETELSSSVTHWAFRLRSRSIVKRASGVFHSSSSVAAIAIRCARSKAKRRSGSCFRSSKWR